MRRIFFLTFLGLFANVSATAGSPPQDGSGSDFRKDVVELPLKDALFSSAIEAQPLTGLVSWHATLDDARRAAGTSKRPILLFQLLGRLDEEFC